MRNSRSCLFLVPCFIIVLLGVASFLACMAAEIRKPKKEDLRLDGKLCYLPGSRAFMYGISALICLCAAQVIGNLVVCKMACFGGNRNHHSSKKPIATTVLLVLSWISCGVAILLLVGATSMSRRQAYGEGWLDGECYLVKDGIYVGSGVLALVTVVLTLSSAIITVLRIQREQSQKM